MNKLMIRLHCVLVLTVSVSAINSSGASYAERQLAL